MGIKVDKVDEKRINCKESFELCYLRHKYLKRVKYAPSREEMKLYKGIADKFSRNTFFFYKNLFLLVGIELEDMENIAQVHLVSFLGLFALERNPDKLKAFKKTFRSYNSIVCAKEDILNKNKANFTCFLKQRMEDVVRVCRQKARNIKGFGTEDFLIFKGTKRPPNDIEELLEDHEKYGYKPFPMTAFKLVRKRMDKQEGPVYLQDGVWYACVPRRKKTLTLTDFVCQGFDPHENEHNLNPEETLERTQSITNLKNDRNRFESLSDKERSKLIQLFVDKNKNNPEFEEEIRTAQKYLKELE